MQKNRCEQGQKIVLNAKIARKEALRVRFELTRCDAPLVCPSRSPEEEQYLKTSAVGRLATSARKLL